LNVAGQQKSDLRLHSRVNEPVETDRLSVGRDHAAGHPAVQRGVKAHGLLLVLACQPKFVSDERLAGPGFGVNKEALRLVGGGHFDIWVFIAELGNARPFRSAAMRVSAISCAVSIFDFPPG
jgi:hypothetical protein